MLITVIMCELEITRQLAKKHYLCIVRKITLILVLLALGVGACRGGGPEAPQEPAPATPPETPVTPGTPAAGQDSTVTSMKVIIGSSEYPATLSEGKAGQAFAALLPMSLDMKELNGNEKYHYLSSSLPSSASNPGTIEAGDIMLFGSDCVVVFYKSFKTSYSYTRIGKITDPKGLESALGAGNVTVRFEK